MTAPTIRGTSIMTRSVARVFYTTRKIVQLMMENGWISSLTDMVSCIMNSLKNWIRNSPTTTGISFKTIGLNIKASSSMITNMARARSCLPLRSMLRVSFSKICSMDGASSLKLMESVLKAGGRTISLLNLRTSELILIN